MVGSDKAKSLTLGKISSTALTLKVICLKSLFVLVSGLRKCANSIIRTEPGIFKTAKCSFKSGVAVTLENCSHEIISSKTHSRPNVCL